MISVKHLYKSFNGQMVLKDINIDIVDGGVLVVLGESGSGKSVLLKHLIGIMKPDRGTVEINGQDITRYGERELLTLRKDIGYLFQEGALYDFMNVYENVAFPLQEHTSLKKKEIASRVIAMLEKVGLGDALKKFPAELSGGMKKRAALARAVILKTPLLFCDEPTSGLDPIKSREITDLIKTIASQLNCTTVMTSHDVINSLRVADRIAVIHSGEIVLEGTPDEVRSSDIDFMKKFLS